MKKPSASEKYQIYMRGWRDGAAGRGMDIIARNHETLQDFYVLGHKDGYEARAVASQTAYVKFGYQPSILRTQEEPLG